MSEKADNFEDKYTPYGDEEAYKELIAEYKRRYGEGVVLEYSLGNYGKVYNAILGGKKL